MKLREFAGELRPLGRRCFCSVCGNDVEDAEVVNHGNEKYEAICECGRSLVVWLEEKEPA